MELLGVVLSGLTPGDLEDPGMTQRVKAGSLLLPRFLNPLYYPLYLLLASPPAHGALRNPQNFLQIGDFPP